MDAHLNSFVAVGKVAGEWHALGQGTPAPRLRIGNGRRRTLTAAQLAGAARFETELLARRAGRKAGFTRTFALPDPAATNNPPNGNTPDFFND